MENRAPNCNVCGAPDSIEHEEQLRMNMAKATVREALLIQGNAEDAMAIIEDYGFDDDDLTLMQELMEEATK